MDRKGKYQPGTGPANPKRAELLETGCIRNYPSTNQRVVLGVIAPHVVAPKGTKQPFEPDRRCGACRRPTSRHARGCHQRAVA